MKHVMVNVSSSELQKSYSYGFGCYNMHEQQQQKNPISLKHALLFEYIDF